MDKFDSIGIDYETKQYAGIDKSDVIIIEDDGVTFKFDCTFDNQLFGSAQFGDYRSDNIAYSKIWTDDYSVNGMIDFYKNLTWDKYCETLEEKLKQIMENFWSSKKETGIPIISKKNYWIYCAAKGNCSEVYKKVIKEKYRNYIEDTIYYIARNNHWR